MANRCARGSGAVARHPHARRPRVVADRSPDPLEALPPRLGRLHAWDPGPLVRRGFLRRGRISRHTGPGAVVRVPHPASLHRVRAGRTRPARTSAGGGLVAACDHPDRSASVVDIGLAAQLVACPTGATGGRIRPARPRPHGGGHRAPTMPPARFRGHPRPSRRPTGAGCVPSRWQEVPLRPTRVPPVSRARLRLRSMCGYRIAGRGSGRSLVGAGCRGPRLQPLGAVRGAARERSRRCVGRSCPRRRERTTS